MCMLQSEVSQNMFLMRGFSLFVKFACVQNQQFRSNVSLGLRVLTGNSAYPVVRKKLSYFS